MKHIKELIQSNAPKKTVNITQEQYEQFKREYIFISLTKGLTFGEAFTEYFNFEDYLLSRDHNNQRVDKLIRRAYIGRQQVVSVLLPKSDK
jgi:hypothetical protein